MAKIPTPRSYNQILGDMLSTFLSHVGLRRLRPGSPALSVFTAAAQSDVRSTKDHLDLLNANSLDRNSGLAVDRVGADEGVERLGESPATGRVDITDTSFTKRETRIYQGRAAPIAGSYSLHVLDAQDFPASGSVYIDRGGRTYEGPLAYSAKTDAGSYWTLTLAQPTQRYHNLGDSVVLAQGGNRPIPAGTIVQASSGGLVDSLRYATLRSVTIADGETEVKSVPVICQSNGSLGNVPARAINSFLSPPFPGATVSNPVSINNGQDLESDDDYKDRIRLQRQSRSKATSLAIRNALQNLTALDENRRITSVSVVERLGQPTTVYIDDGTGYEEGSVGVPVETVVDSAVGGEDQFQVSFRPLAKAFLRTSATAPFPLREGAVLSVAVGGVVYSHAFPVSDFRSITNATSYEVASSINSNPTLGFGARTEGGGSYVVLVAKDDTNEDLQVLKPSLAVDANSALLFPSSPAETMLLYRNDRLLSKDGAKAVLISNPVSGWGTVSGDQTLILDVDGTGEHEYTITAQDFIDARTGYSVVAANSVAAWVKVLNAKLPGVTATVVGGLISLTSNAGATAKASLAISSSSTLVAAKVFSASSSQGRDRDYSLDRSSGYFRLEQPLAAGDRLSIGSSTTRPFLESPEISTTALDLDSRLWLALDAGAEIVDTGAGDLTPLTLSVAPEAWGVRATFSSAQPLFLNVRIGDYVVFTDVANSGWYRVQAVAVDGTSFEIDRAVYAETPATVSGSSLFFVRAHGPLQSILIQGGVSYLGPNLVDSINSQIRGGFASSYRTNRIRIHSNSFGGDIAVVGQDGEAQSFGLGTGDAVAGVASHRAAVESGTPDYGTPDFSHTHVTEIVGSVLTLDHTAPVSSGSVLVGVDGARVGNCSYSRVPLEYGDLTAGASKSIRPRQSLPWLVEDHVYAARPWAIGPEDDLTLVVDGDAASKRFLVPFSRRLQPVGSYGSVVSFQDLDNGGEPLSLAFGSDFDFADCALYMRARALTYSGQSQSLLWRYKRLGPDGNGARIRFVYPDAPSANVSVATDAARDQYVNVSVALPSAAAKNSASLRYGTRVGVKTADLGGSVAGVIFVVGYSVSEAVRTTRIRYSGRNATAFAGTVTGGSSGATATVVSDTGTGAGTGYLVLSSISGSFISGETLTAGAATATASGTVYGHVTLTLTLPGTLVPVADHKLTAGTVLYLEGSGDALVPSGPITVVSATATSISYEDTIQNLRGTVADAGSVSLDQVPVSFTGAGPDQLAVGDLFRFSVGAGLPASVSGQTLRALEVGPKFIAARIEGPLDPAYANVTMFSLQDPKAFSVFSVDGEKARVAAVSASVNAMGNECPVTATVLGDPTSQILKSDLDQFEALTWTSFADGINYIASTTYPTADADYSFTLKDATAAALSGSPDWTNEEVRIAPQSASACSRWLNCIGVTGLSSVCEVVDSSQAHRLQISSLTLGSGGSLQIQGGTANAASAPVVGTAVAVGSQALVLIPEATATGLVSGNWVRIENSLCLPKAALTADTTVASITGDGVISVSSTLQRVTGTGTGTWIVRRHGAFVCYTMEDVAPLPDFSGVSEGDWVQIDAAPVDSLQAPNLGRFRVVRVENGASSRSFWVENGVAVPEVADAAVTFYDFDSVLPGDKLVIAGTAWGLDNVGTWTVVEATEHSLRVDTSIRAMSPQADLPALGLGYRLYQILESTPTRLFKQIQSLSPNGTRYLDLKLTTAAGHGLISEAAGSVAVALDKLEFPVDLVQGLDGYSHHTGLLAEANRVLYGDPSDSATYPGVVAAQAGVNVSGPRVKRILVSLMVWAKGTAEVRDRVQSAVASVINRSGVGKPVAISDIVAAAAAVAGVQAVSVISPAYGVGKGLIPVQAQEKPMVVDLNQISVSFVGE